MHPLTRSSSAAALLSLGLVAAHAPAQCAPLHGGLISYCTPLSRTLSAPVTFGSPVTASSSTIGRWDRSVLGYQPEFDPPPDTSGAGTLYGGGGYAQQDSTLAANSIFGAMRATAWDGNQDFGGGAVSTLSTTFTLPSAQTAIITGAWTVTGAPGPGGDGSVPAAGLSLSGNGGAVYSGGFTGGTPATSGTLAYRAVVPAGTYTLGVTAAESFTNPAANLGSRTATINFTLTLCRADFDLSGTVSVQDLFAFLIAYFAGDARADFNISGAVSIQDVFDFLIAYFPGCP